jgi:hypothetical protein
MTIVTCRLDALVYNIVNLDYMEQVTNMQAKTRLLVGRDHAGQRLARLIPLLKVPQAQPQAQPSAPEAAMTGAE